MVARARWIACSALAALVPLVVASAAQPDVGRWTVSLGYQRAQAVRALAIDPVNPKTLYAGDFVDRVFKSADGGRSWKVASAGLPSPSPQAPASVLALAIDPRRPQTLYAGGDGGRVFKSTDGAGRWKAASAGLARATSAVRALAIDPAGPLYAGLLLTGEFAPVFKSTNRAASWRSASNGLVIDNVNALAIARGALYAGTGAGVFKSTDGAATWTAAHTGLARSGEAAPLAVFSLAVGPRTPQTLYAGTSAGVFKSTNGAVSWGAAGTGLPAASVLALAIDPRAPQTLYAGTESGGVYKSTNGGASWSATNRGLTGTARPVFALAIDPRGQALFAGTEFGVFKLVLRASR